MIDLERALAFFNIFRDSKRRSAVESYAYVYRETAGSASLEQNGPGPSTPGNRRFAHFVDVRDIDSLYPELKPELDALPKADVLGASTSCLAKGSFLSSLPTAI